MSTHKHFGAEKVVKGNAPHASADMNVTPLIDVLLVLLVIFMAALPLTQKGLDVDLPIATKPPSVPDSSAQIMLELTADRQITVNRQPVAPEALQDFLRSVFEGRSEKTIFIAAAGTLRYAEIVQVIDAAKGAGVEKVGIVTDRMRRGS